MGDRRSSLIFSIDIGIINIGVALYDSSTKKMVYCDRIAFAPSLKALKSQRNIPMGIYNLMFNKETSKIYPMLKEASIILIEDQMRLKMYIAQYSIVSMCICEGFEYKIVHSKSVKTFFKTGAASRKLAGKVVRGAENNRRANKAAAIVKAHELFPKDMAKVPKAKQDDVADAILQACWYDRACLSKK